MTQKMRSAWVVSAPTRTGSAIAWAILSVAIISGGPATAAGPWPPWPNTPAEMQKLIYSPWAKVCSKGQDPGATEVCFTRKDARTADGETIVTVALIEPEGKPRKLLRVTLPNRIPLLHYTTRIIIDKVPATNGKFFTCFGGDGCRADHEATPELVDKLKEGRMLVVQVISFAPADATAFALALVGPIGSSFARANEEPPTDPKVFEEQQARQLEEQQARQRKFEEQRIRQRKGCDYGTFYWCRF